MSQHDSPKQKSILWIIFPIAILLTLMFVNRNRTAVHELHRLDGNVERVVKNVEHTPVHHVSDTVHVATPADTAHAAPAAHGAAH
jgi:hypothetical protein